LTAIEAALLTTIALLVLLGAWERHQANRRISHANTEAIRAAFSRTGIEFAATDREPTKADPDREVEFHPMPEGLGG
jgi:hypothetical protein